MPFPVTPVLDTCNRADENPVAGGWGGTVPGSGNSLKIVSNQLQAVAAPGSAYWNQNYGANQEVYFTNTDNASRIDLLLRLTGEGTATYNCYYVIMYCGASTLLDFYKVVGGSFTFLDEPTVSGYAAGDVLGFRVVGTSLTAWRNGTQIASFTDSAVTGGGKLGMFIQAAAVNVDSFGGGGVTPEDRLASILVSLPASYQRTQQRKPHSILRPPRVLAAPAALPTRPPQVTFARPPQRAQRRRAGSFLRAPTQVNAYVFTVPLRAWLTEQVAARLKRRKPRSFLNAPRVIQAAPPVVTTTQTSFARANRHVRRRSYSILRRPVVVAAKPVVLIPITVALAQQVAAERRRRPTLSVLRAPTVISPFVPPPPPPEECGTGPLPYLKVGDIEIANAARTVEYLRNGLGSGHWNLGACNLCNVLYRPDGGCTPVTFASPAADPAPWYTAAEPGATSFLGVVLLDLRGYDSTITRVVTPRIQGLGGASFSGQRRNPREWKFRAALVSRDDKGAEYGLRWLTQALEASYCDTCTTGSLTVRLVCPPSDCSDDGLGEWTSYDVALVDGPREVEKWAPSNMQDVLAGCRDMTVVEWSMVAGNPFLYKAAEACLEAEIIGENAECDDICDFLFGPAGEAHCCQVAPPARGVLGSIITLQSVSGMNSVLLGAYAQCPTSDEPEPIYQMELSGVPAGGTVVVDSAKHTVTVTAPDENGDLVTSDGSSLIVLSEDQPLEWIEARDCDDVGCFCARTAHPCSQGGDTLVSIQTQLREG